MMQTDSKERKIERRKRRCGKIFWMEKIEKFPVEYRASIYRRARYKFVSVWKNVLSRFRDAVTHSRTL